MVRVMNFIGAGCAKRPRRNEELRKGELGRGAVEGGVNQPGLLYSGRGEQEYSA